MTDKIALITGASSGIGNACAHAFAAAGYRIAAVASSAQSFATAELPANTQQIVADLSDTAGAAQVFAELPAVAVLVNAAGAIDRSKTIDAARFTRCLQLHTVAPFQLSELAVARGATAIVNIGSMRALAHQATTPDYSAAKAALHNLTIALAKKYAPTCTVNCIAPGFTRTAMHAGNEARLATEATKTPTGETIAPQQIAEIVLLTAHNRALNGSIIVADGGRNFGG